MTKTAKSAFIVTRRVMKPGDTIEIPRSIPYGLYDVVALKRERIEGHRAHIDLDLPTRDKLKTMAKSFGTTYDRLVKALMTLGELNKELVSMIV